MNLIIPRDFSASEIRILVLGFALRLAAAGVFASYFLVDLFIPFLGTFINDPSTSPYKISSITGVSNAFPYPAVMLYYLSFFLAPLHSIASENLFLMLISVRFALLVAEWVMYVTMRGWLPKTSRQRFTILFWLNPITFYISYVHGQLDVVAISILVMSMAQLFQGKIKASAIVYSLALATKTSVLLTLPVFCLFFLQRKSSAHEAAQFCLIAAAGFLVANAQFLIDPTFIEMVFNNKEQAKLLSFQTEISDRTIYWIIIFLLALFTIGYKIGISNQNLFIMFCAFYFSAVLLVLPPMNGWYWWIIPFFAFFFSLARLSSIHLFAGLHAFYFAYFLISPDSNFLEIINFFDSANSEPRSFYLWAKNANLPVELLTNMVYTLLQGTLFLLCVQVFYSGLMRYRLQRLSGRPFIIGIGGNSGVGKTTLASELSAVFGLGNTTILRGDDRHKWQRGAKEWDAFTHLNPKANYLHDEIDTLKELKTGKKVWRRSYDHSTGMFTEPMPIVPNKLMILEGLHPFYLSNQREIYDLRVFIQPEEQLARHWKIMRDQEKRGHSKEAIINQINTRQSDFETFIAAQAPYADILVTPRSDRAIKDSGNPDEHFDIFYDLTLTNSFALDAEIMAIEALESVQLSHRYEGVNHQVLTISGDVVEEQIQYLYQGLEIELQEAMVGQNYTPRDLAAVVIYIVSKLILKEANNG